MPEFARIVESPLDRDEVEALLLGDEMGAVVSFVGRVRNHDPEAQGEVVALEYSAHPDAEAVLAELLREFTQARREGSNPVRVAAVHRIGRLAVGDAALIVSVAAAHRTDTFELCRDLVEEIKARVPIWKKQLTAAGAGAWVGIA